MKQTIFSKGKGWYISCSNYKDENDKAYLNLYFPKNSEPPYADNGRGYSVKQIDILEAKFTSYQGKVGLTVFKYTEIKDEPKKEQEQKDDTKEMFGSSTVIEQDELPFY